ncbi:Chitin bind 4 domain containing protein, partial [Asbolus verrucosus]
IFVVALITFKLTFALTLHSNKNDVDYNSYKFDYGVEDHHTGDIKSHQEIKIGKEVSGVYTLREADGTTRVLVLIKDLMQLFKNLVILNTELTITKQARVNLVALTVIAD